VTIKNKKQNLKFNLKINFEIQFKILLRQKFKIFKIAPKHFLNQRNLKIFGYLIICFLGNIPRKTTKK
jgi:hypothetical protein